MEKEIKMNNKRVIQALKNWSPNGLCGGTLVQKNGDPAKTEACAIGCLALEFAYSKEGKSFFRKVKGGKTAFLKHRLYEQSGIDGEFRDRVGQYFGVDKQMIDSIMSYNDDCIKNKGKPVVKSFSIDQNDVPASVRKTIYSLRKRFGKFAEKMTKQLRKEGKFDEWDEYPGA